jgi:hypothetical protein
MTPWSETRDYFYRLPRGALDLTKGEERVYLHVAARRDDAGEYRGTNAEIARATGLHPATVGAIVARLARERPAGVDHPFFRIEGGTRRRRIRVLYLPKDASHKPPTIRSAAATDPGPIRTRRASNPEPETPGNPGVAASPLFSKSGGEKGNDNDVIVVADPPPRPRTHAHARAEPASRPAAPAPTPTAGPRPVTTAAVLARFQALQERLAAEEARSPDPAPGRGAGEPLTAEIAAARELADARPADGPPPGPPAYSQGLPRAKSPPGPRLAGLVHALYRSDGDPAAVGELVRHLAWLFDSTKPETVRCWTRGFGEAVAWLEPDELLAIIGAAGAPRVERFRRCRYLSRALTDRLVKAKREGLPRRRE